MTSYSELGVKTAINAAATWTKVGGSIMPASVVDAMTLASRHFIDLFELQRKVGERIAELTHNEACYVSSGAAAGITLAVTACIAGTDHHKMEALPYLDGTPRNVVVFKAQRNAYDFAARQTGARLREVGPSAQELDAAIDHETCCVLWFANARYAVGDVTLADTVRIAHAKDVPVLVDAAAQIPPISNLWHFTRDEKADIVIFSGGKGLRGPQSSGLVLGRRDLIEGCRANGAPNHAIGRPMKVGKEELMGCLAAVEWSLQQDEAGTIDGYEASVRMWVDELNKLPGIKAERSFPSEAGQPYPRAVFTIHEPSRWTRDAVIDALWEQNPRIVVHLSGNAVALNPQTLEPGEDRIVLKAIQRVLASEPGA